MNPQRAQLRIAAIYAQLSAVIIVVLTTIAINGGTDRIRNTTQRELTDHVSKLVARIDLNAPPTNDDNSWLVDAQNATAKKLALTSLEPPLIGLANDIINRGPQFREFAQDGQPYVLYGQRLPNSQLVIAAAQGLQTERDQTSSWRLRLWSLAVALIALTGALSYLIAGWALRPARRAHEQQRVFLANAAHELRTPLAVIRASSSQTLERSRANNEYVRSLEEINMAATRATELVSDMLELARLDAGQTIPRRAPLRLDLLAEEVAAMTNTAAVSVTALIADAVVVDADYGLLRQAMENVVRNATRRAATVEISVRVNGSEALVEVSDDGPGFTAELLTTVFDRFRRGDHEHDREGTGLGLAIVQTIMAAHGGSASADNRPMRGAIVTLTMPKARQ